MRRSPWLTRLGHFFFGYRDYLIPFTFLVLSVTTVPEFPFGSERLDRWLDIGGLRLPALDKCSGSVSSVLPISNAVDAINRSLLIR